MKSQKEDWIRKVKKSVAKIDKRELKFLAIKESLKFILFPFVFLTISGHIVMDFTVYCMGDLSAYLKHDILRLFVDSYYITTALSYGHSTDVYFKYITNELHVELYLWIIPFIMAIIYSYISYWIVHKIVDRNGIGATKMLNFYYFFFIFGISNILSRIISHDYDILPIPVHILWYIIYKILKISVLKIKEKTINKGEENV